MTGDIADDPTLARVQALPRVAPTPDSAARIRSRSQAALARSPQRDWASARLATRLVDGAFVLGCFVYLSGAAAQAWRLFRAIK
jgi:hypothetical protein